MTKLIYFTTAFLIGLSASGIRKFPQAKLVNLNFSNTVFISEEITPATVHKDIGDLVGKRLSIPRNETLYVVIPSYGGSVPDGVRLANLVAKLPNTKLICVFCASMAAALFEMTPQKRLVTKNSVILMHEMKITISAAGLTPELVKEFKKYSSAFNKMFADVLGWSLYKYETAILNKNLIYKGQDIKKMKLADEVVRINCDEYITEIAPNMCRKD
jgi:ATP-dependent protease ClpP protease subunit